MPQDKTLREQLRESIKDRRIGSLIEGEKGKVFVDTDDILEKERMINIFEDKIKSVVREMRGKYLYLDDHEVGSARYSGYEESLDDLLERLGIK